MTSLASTTWPELAQASAAPTFKLCGGPGGAAPRTTVDPALFRMVDLRQLELSDLGLVTLAPWSGPALPTADDDSKDGGDGDCDCDDADDDAAAAAATGVCCGGPGCKGCRAPAATPSARRATPAASFAALTGLQDLTLSQNALGPHISPRGALFGLTALRSLDLSRNGLESIPAEIASCVSLGVLDVSFNDLSALPGALGALTALTTFRASANQLTCAGLPEPFFGLPRLAECVLRGNQLVGSLPVGFARMPALKELDIADNALTMLDVAFAHPDACQRLKKLVIQGNPWSDKKLAKMGGGAQGGGAQVPKKIFEVLRNGMSKRGAKNVLRAAPKPRPPRMYAGPDASVGAESEMNFPCLGAGGGGETKEGGPDLASGDGEGGGGGGKQGKGKGKGKGNGKGNGKGKGKEKGKGKAKGQAAKGGASNQSPTTDHPRPAPLRQVRVRRDALSVRPHLLVCVVHIVWDPSVGGATRDGGDDSDNDDDNDDDESWGDDGSDGDASGGKGAVGGLRGFGNDDSSDTDSSDDSDEHAAAASGGAAKKGTANTPKKNAPPFVFSQGASVDAGAFEAHVGIIEMRALSGVKNAGAVGGGAGGGDEGPGGGSGGGAGTLSNQDEDPARTAAVAAVARMAGFISAQTRIHGNRKSGALGSHNASEVTFPLRYNAEPHEDVVFSPLSVGWKQEKGVYTASEFAHASLRDSGLGRPAKALLALPLCPVLRDASERVMSVAPLSNGYATRTTADARGGIVLECSSSEGEAPCRDMLLALVLEMITMAEGDPSSDSPTSGLHVLIEPVQIVADWDNALQFACFPSRDELLALPPLP